MYDTTHRSCFSAFIARNLNDIIHTFIVESVLFNVDM